MKKAQILSAIALAMALGVVAPVASANALTKEVRNDQDQVTTHGKATCGERVKAANSIKNNASYKRLAAFYNTAAAIKNDAEVVVAGKGAVSTWDAATFSGLYDGIDGAYGSLVTFGAGLGTAIDYATNAMDKATDGATYTPAKGVVAVKAELDAVANIYRYNDYKAIYTAVEEKNITKFESAIKSFDAKYDDAFGSSAITNFSTLFTAAKGNTGAFAVTTEYGYFKALISAVEDARAIYTKYMDAYNRLMAKWNELGTLKNSAAKATAVSDALSLAKTAAVKTDDITNYVFATLGADLEASSVNPTYIWGAADWNDVIATQLPALVLCDANNPNETEANWDALMTAAISFGKAIYRDTRSLSQRNTLIAELAAGADVAEGEKPADVTDAPASGVLGTAEGSATTVSIVAGLATALTALGAGVVAYRNARREK